MMDLSLPCSCSNIYKQECSVQANKKCIVGVTCMFMYFAATDYPFAWLTTLQGSLQARNMYNVCEIRLWTAPPEKF